MTGKKRKTQSALRLSLCPGRPGQQKLPDKYPANGKPDFHIAQPGIFMIL
jgi:hypothetical protein